MSQNPKALVKNIKQYFDQNVHDTKNLFNYLSIWLNAPDLAERKVDAQAMLQEMQQTYLTKIEELRDSFDEFLSVSTGATNSIEIESLADWLSSYLKNYWNDRNNPGQLMEELDGSISLNYPPSYLASIVNSLLDNAVQYQSENRELVVQVTLSQQADSAVLRVKDNGAGIDLERYRNLLFQPFQRFSSQGEGKGLSLHLIKAMVERNGGKIELVSTPQEGTTVTVFLKGYE